MRDLPFLAVALVVFGASAGVSMLLAWPVLKWAERGQDWQAVVAVLWLVVCFGAAQYLAFRVMRASRRWVE